MIFQSVQIRLNVHFPPTEATNGIDERDRRSNVFAERGGRARLAEEKRSLVPRDTGFLSPFLFLSRVYTDLAHFVPHSGHTYAVASRTSSKFTAREHAAGTDARLRPYRATPGRSSSAHRHRSHIF